MLTKVVLGGAMGRIQGKEFWLDVNSPNEAIQMINANKPGFVNWIRKNRHIFDFYRVTCEHENGTQEHLDEEAYMMNCKVKTIRFTPILAGSGKYAQFIIAAVFIVVGAIMDQPQLIMSGVSMMISGIINLFIRPSKGSTSEDSTTSYYFDGAANTTQQGSPIPLVFGRCKVGSVVINSSILIKDK